MKQTRARKIPAPKLARATAAQNTTASPASSTATAHAPNLGECLRAIRFKRRLSLADVSAATGLASSTLSRVETNQLSLTYAKLVQLSRGLQVDLAELLSAQVGGASQPAMTRRTLTAPGEGTVVAVGTSAYRYMCTELSAKRMTPMTAEIRARKLDETNGLLSHPGEEFVYVLSGTVQLLTDIYEPLTVVTGACIYFDSTMRHTYLALGDTPAMILCICSSDDATIHHAVVAPPVGSLTAPSQRKTRGALRTQVVRGRNT